MKATILLLITILFSLASEIKAQSDFQSTTTLAPSEVNISLSRNPYLSFIGGFGEAYGLFWKTEEVSLEKNQELIVKIDHIDSQYFPSNFAYEIFDGTYWEYATATAKNSLQPKSASDNIDFSTYHFQATNDAGIAYIYFYYCDRFHPAKYYLLPCIKVTVR
ncbi:MAG: hypothetical protein FJ390_08465 [Verrucomicrobia bacterium]|nr:hypothetical protein [Verrucomicrobiota bacterium]